MFFPFSYGFSHCFPMICPFSHGFPMVFPWVFPSPAGCLRLRHIFFNLHVEVSEQPLLLTEPALNPKANRERLIQSM